MLDELQLLLAGIKSAVALAPNKLAAIEDGGLLLAPSVKRGDIARGDAVAFLTDVAKAHGLCSTERGRLDVEHVNKMAINGQSAGVRRAPTQQARVNTGDVDAASGVAVRGPSKETWMNGAAPSRILRCAADIAPEKIEWVWPGRIARGKQTLIAGDPGTGKRQVTISIAAAVTIGGDLPCEEGRAPRGNVIILSAEARDWVLP